MSVTACTHTQTHTDYLILYSSVILQMRSTLTAVLPLHSWGEIVLGSSVPVHHGGGGTFLLCSIRSRRDQFPEGRDHQGMLVSVAFNLLKVTQRLHSYTEIIVHVCYRWQKWRRILAGSQQRSGGSVATCRRTTFPSFLISKTNILYLLALIPSNMIKDSHSLMSVWAVRRTTEHWCLVCCKNSSSDPLLMCFWCSWWTESTVLSNVYLKLILDSK